MVFDCLYDRIMAVWRIVVSFIRNFAVGHSYIYGIYSVGRFQHHGFHQTASLFRESVGPWGQKTRSAGPERSRELDQVSEARYQMQG